MPEREDRERIDEHKLPTALLVHEVLREDGEEETERAPVELFASGIAGGFSMGLSLVGAGVLHAHLPETKWRILITSIGFTLGFIVVMIGRQGLVTESALSAVLPTLRRPSRRTLFKMLRLWALVLVGNLAAISLFAWVVTLPGVFSAETRDAFGELGKTVLDVPFGVQLLRALLAGWVIALALWVSPAAGPGRIIVIPMLTWLVGAASFGHIVSGSGEALAAVFMHRAQAAEYFVRFFVPVLIGNMIGGAVFVAALNHLQVFHEQREQSEG